MQSVGDSLTPYKYPAHYQNSAALNDGVISLYTRMIAKTSSSMVGQIFTVSKGLPFFPESGVDSNVCFKGLQFIIQLDCLRAQALPSLTVGAPPSWCLSCDTTPSMQVLNIPYFSSSAHLVPTLPQLRISHFSVELRGMQLWGQDPELLECPFFISSKQARKQVYIQTHIHVHILKSQICICISSSVESKV